MMECPTRLIKCFAADESLSSSEVDAIHRHLESCPSCRTLVQEETAITKSVRCLRAIELPPDFASSVLERIRAYSSGIFASPREWHVAAAFTFGMLLLGGFCVLLDQGLKNSGAEALDVFILQSFAFVADVLLFGLRAAVSIGQVGVQVLQIFSGLLSALGRWLLTLPSAWHLLALSLFALSNGTLFWIMRHHPPAKEHSR